MTPEIIEVTFNEKRELAVEAARSAAATAAAASASRTDAVSRTANRTTAAAARGASGSVVTEFLPIFGIGTPRTTGSTFLATCAAFRVHRDLAFGDKGTSRLCGRSRRARLTFVSVDVAASQSLVVDPLSAFAACSTSAAVSTDACTSSAAAGTAVPSTARR